MGLTPNVVDGDVIEAAWGNQIRDRTIQPFASSAELLAQWPDAPVGSYASIGGLLHRKVSSTAWAQHIGLVHTAADDYTSMAAAGAGVHDRPLTMLAQPVATHLLVRSMAYGGFGTSALTSIQFSLYSNALTAPPGGAWIVNGPVLTAAQGVWTSLGSLTYVLPVPVNTAVNVTARVVYAPAASNCHVRFMSYLEAFSQ